MPAITRRYFLGSAGTFAAAGAVNDRIRIGLIGAGSRGAALLRELAKVKEANFAIPLICDVWSKNRERTAAAVAQEFGAAPKAVSDYREVLGDKSIDAVLLAAPDFTHSPMLEQAVAAGKDAYCEKPFGVEIDRARSAWRAAGASQQIVQAGTQRRSMGEYLAAARLIQSGALGRITRVDISVNFYQARWRRDHSDVREADVDWKNFTMHRAPRPFDARRLREWQLFRDYTNGISGLWMCHFIDTVAWFLEDPYPESAVAHGGVYLWKDGRETEDVFHALLSYPKGFLVSFAMSLVSHGGDRNLWFGTEGTLDMDAMTYTRGKEKFKLDPDPQQSHMGNFLECVRSRKAPRAAVDAGFSHAVACCLAGEALDKGRRMRFDREKLAIV